MSFATAALLLGGSSRGSKTRGRVGNFLLQALVEFLCRGGLAAFEQVGAAVAAAARGSGGILGVLLVVVVVTSATATTSGSGRGRGELHVFFAGLRHGGFTKESDIEQDLGRCRAGIDLPALHQSNGTWFGLFL